MKISSNLFGYIKNNHESIVRSYHENRTIDTANITVNLLYNVEKESKAGIIHR